MIHYWSRIPPRIIQKIKIAGKVESYISESSGILLEEAINEEYVSRIEDEEFLENSFHRIKLDKFEF